MNSKFLAPNKTSIWIYFFILLRLFAGNLLTQIILLQTYISRLVMLRGQWTFRNRQRTGSNIWLKTTSFIIAKRILGIYTCPILTFTQRSIVVMLYNGSIGRKSIIITVDPVIVKQRDTLQRYVRSTVHAFRKDNRMNIIAIKETKFQRHFCLHLFR